MQNVQNGVVLGSYRSLKVTENSIIHQSAIRNYTTPLIFLWKKMQQLSLKACVNTAINAHPYFSIMNDQYSVWYS